MLTPHPRLPSTLYIPAPVSLGSEFQIDDPLAFDYLSQQVGYWLFGGFTTRTSRPQDYVVCLYGLHLVQRAIEQYREKDDDETRRALYERWERFWGLAVAEYRKNGFEQSDDDNMRGVRGIKRAWKAGDAPLPLDFRMISRQIELGGLGAYLGSLREYGLVAPGSLRPTPAAREIIEAFWDEPDENSRTHLYEEYALAALDRSRRTIERQRHHITLARVGRMSRLSVLREDKRTKQQGRLWAALFESARDGTTLPIAKVLIAAHLDGVEDIETILDGIVGQRWIPVDDEVRDRALAALAFGRIVRTLLSVFADAYAYVERCGWVADGRATAGEAFHSGGLDRMRREIAAVNATSCLTRLRRLDVHGPTFAGLLAELADADASTALGAILRFQRTVQRTRRWGDGWMRPEGDKLVLVVRGWSGAHLEPWFPSLKFYAVRRMLHDLGRIP
jgi:hypothetical protein